MNPDFHAAPTELGDLCPHPNYRHYALRSSGVCPLRRTAALNFAHHSNESIINGCAPLVERNSNGVPFRRFLTKNRGFFWTDEGFMGSSLFSVEYNLNQNSSVNWLACYDLSLKCCDLCCDLDLKNTRFYRHCCDVATSQGDHPPPALRSLQKRVPSSLAPQI